MEIEVFNEYKENVEYINMNVENKDKYDLIEKYFGE